MVPKGYGENVPIADNRTEDGRARTAASSSSLQNAKLASIRSSHSRRRGFLVMTPGMRARSLVALRDASCGRGHRASAHADPKGDIASQDQSRRWRATTPMDYDAARKPLNQALAIAKKAKLDKDPVTAKAYLDLGIVAFAMPDARRREAVVPVGRADRSEDPDRRRVQVARDGEAARGGARAKRVAVAAASDGPAPSLRRRPTASTARRSRASQHKLDRHREGAARRCRSRRWSAPTSSRRRSRSCTAAEGAIDFTEVKMTKQGDCKYTGDDPRRRRCTAACVHYYVAAYNDGRQADRARRARRARRTSSSIERRRRGAEGRRRRGSDRRQEVGAQQAAARPAAQRRDRCHAAASTVGPKQHEGDARGRRAAPASATSPARPRAANTVKTCCIGNSLRRHRARARRTSSTRSCRSASRRGIGFPIGANIDGHATLAPAGLLRAALRARRRRRGPPRHGPARRRHHPQHDQAQTRPRPARQDTDIVAQGPLLLGGGVGFTKHLSGNIAFLADLSAIAGIAVVNHLGSAPALNSGVTADLSLGLAVGF